MHCSVLLLKPSAVLDEPRAKPLASFLSLTPTLTQSPTPLTHSLASLLTTFASLHPRNPLILSIPQRQIHILQTLRRRPLQQIIDRNIHHRPLPARMHSKPPNLHAMLTRDILHHWRLPRQVNQSLVVVS